MTVTLIFGATIAAAFFGVALVRAIGVKRQLLAIPNERSSHLEPTPHGGGIAIVVISLGFYLFATSQRPGTFSWGYFGGALLIAALSLIDDIYTIPVVWRFLSHAGAAIFVIFERGYWRDLALPNGVTWEVGAGGALLTFVWIVGLVNAYNFMDGIDGIAGVQAVTAGAGWMVIGWLTGSGIAFWLAGGILFSSLGFLLHNWQPARIFMGDVGSAFLGFSFAVLPLIATVGEPSDRLLPMVALMLVWPYVFDTGITILRRVSRRERIWRAHREHLYQRLVQSGWSHAAVSTLYGVLALAVTAGVIYVYAGRPASKLVWLICALATTLALLTVFLITRDPARHAKNT